MKQYAPFVHRKPGQSSAGPLTARLGQCLGVAPQRPLGAVRVEPTGTLRKQLLNRRVLTGAALMSLGVLATTASIGRDTRAEPEMLHATLPAPAFFYSDEADALGEPSEPVEAPGSTRLPAPVATPTSTRLEREPVESPGTPAAIDAAAPDAAVVQPADTALDAALPADDNPQLAMVSHPLPHAAALAPQTEPAGSPASGLIEEAVAVTRGDTLSGILYRHGLKNGQMAAMLAHPEINAHLSRIDIGQVLTIRTHAATGEFNSLETRTSDHKRLVVTRKDSDFAVEVIDLPLEKRRVVTTGVINTNLFDAAVAADVRQSTIMELADIFQWELDFGHDIRKGDRFSLVYDRLYRDEEYIGDGDILAAEFVRGSRTYQAIRFTNEAGVSGYYAPDGRAKRRTFMRHPVDVVRITSKFDPQRMHPVLHQIRAHRGVDYGAPKGTPIKATADGRVSLAGNRGGYGNTVILEHGQNRSTLYAHMSRVSENAVVGARVSQGDVIGYVGDTGRVTGAHLHYEFRVNDEHVDPLTVELPEAAPLTNTELARLTDDAGLLLAQMAGAIETPAGDDEILAGR